ncbi:MAG: hypothetical protein KKC37_11475, partial [Proteobacteria bacterium]|nr:hypothetical protein [Pseudomonadota bacterium]
MTGKIIKITCLVLAGLLLTALVGGWVFRTPLLRLAAGVVLPRLEKQSGLAVRFTDLRVSALGRIEVRGLSVSIKGRRLFTARGLAFGVDLWALFARRIRLTRVTVQGPMVDLRGLPPGRPAAGSDSGRPWTLEVAGLNLMAGRVVGLPALLKSPVEAVDNLAVRGRLEMALGGPGMALQARLDSLSAVVRPQGLVVERLAGRLSLTDRGLTIRALSLATARSSLVLSGTLTDWAAPRLAIRVSRFKVDPGEVARFAPGLPDWLCRALISGRLAVTGDLSGLRFSVQARRRDMTLSARGRIDLTRLDEPA